MNERTELGDASPSPIRPLDRERLKGQFESKAPYPHFIIDEFLEPEFALEAAGAFPTFEQAQEQGFEFNFVRERRKIQISDSHNFPTPITRLNDALASDKFLSDLEFITGISGLLPDPGLSGGGMHVTGSGGRLDVHVDFNFNEDMKVHRRLNILIYLNPTWDPKWGGQIELWDKDVRTCHQRVDPSLNRCVLFETSQTSFHGVRPVAEAAPTPRHSFAAYYYTKDAPDDWNGTHHNTIFRARPDERLRRYVVIPAEQALIQGRAKIREFRAKLQGRD